MMFRTSTSLDMLYMYKFNMGNSLAIASLVLLSLAFMHSAMATEYKKMTEYDAEVSGQGGEIPMTAGYDKNSADGFFIRSKDEQFRLNIGAYTQARYDINWRDAPAGEDDVENGYYFNRTILIFNGQFTPLFDYHFRMNFTEEGTDLDIAYLQYNFDNNWLRVGRQFFAISREDWMWSQDVLTTEYSVNDATFALGVATGVQAHFQARKQRYWLGVSDASAGVDDEQSELTLNGRWEYQLSGSDWSVWDDIIGRKGRSQGVLLGAGGAYQFEKDPSTFDRIAQLNADVSFNGDGYQVIAAASWTRHEPEVGAAYNNYGFLAQGGYFFTNHSQAYAQYNLISPGDQPGDLETFNSITTGVNYFPFLWTNRWKFSMEIAHLFDTLNKTIVESTRSLGWLPSDEDGQTYLRLQAQFGF